MSNKIRRKTSKPGCSIRLQPIEASSSFPSKNSSIGTSVGSVCADNFAFRSSRFLASMVSPLITTLHEGTGQLWRQKRDTPPSCKSFKHEKVDWAKGNGKVCV